MKRIKQEIYLTDMERAGGEIIRLRKINACLLKELRLIANAVYKDGRNYDKYDAQGFVKIAQQAIAKAEGEVKP